MRLVHQITPISFKLIWTLSGKSYICKASRRSRQASQSWASALILVAFFYTLILLNDMVYFCYIDKSGTPQVPGNTWIDNQ